MTGRRSSRPHNVVGPGVDAFADHDDSIQSPSAQPVDAYRLNSPRHGGLTGWLSGASGPVSVPRMAIVGLAILTIVAAAIATAWGG